MSWHQSQTSVESPEVPVGFVRSRYLSSATRTGILKHSETVIVFAIFLFISILFNLHSYLSPISFQWQLVVFFSSVVRVYFMTRVS